MARTVRTKIFQFSELNSKAKEKAKKQLHALSVAAHTEEFVRGETMTTDINFTEWKAEHFNTKDYEFTKEGNIFFK